jgi:hypothetical protein
LPAASRRDGASVRNTPSMTGAHEYTLRFVAATNWSTGRLRRHARLSLALAHVVLLTMASYEGWYADAGLYANVVAVPLSRMAAR